MNLLIKNFKVLKWQVSLVAIIWFLLAAIGTLLKIRLGIDKIGNYLIFENTFYRTIYQTNLYWIDPSANLGSYLYGPLFSILIAPFAVCPVKTGAFLWGMANAAILFLAIKKLPVADYDKNFIVLFSAIEMVTSVQNMQINCIIASLIILSFIFVEKEKDFWATFFIVAGFLIKIYGIAGIVFFFSQNVKSDLSGLLSFGW